MPLRGDVVDEVRDNETDQRLEDHRGDGENARLPHHQPKGFALEQELEIAETDEALHRLVQGCQMQGIECWINNQNCDEKDQRQRHEKGCSRFPLHCDPQTGALAYASSAGNTVRLKCDINHDASSSRASSMVEKPASRRLPVVWR